MSGEKITSANDAMSDTSMKERRGLVPTDRCIICGRKFDEVVFRFDQSDVCTWCQHFDSDQMKRSRESDRRDWCRINGRVR